MEGLELPGQHQVTVGGSHCEGLCYDFKLCLTMLPLKKGEVQTEIGLQMLHCFQQDSRTGYTSSRDALWGPSLPHAPAFLYTEQYLERLSGPGED